MRTDIGREPTVDAKVEVLTQRLRPMTLEQLRKFAAHDAWSKLLTAQFPPDGEALRMALDAELAEATPKDEQSENSKDGA